MSRRKKPSGNCALGYQPECRRCAAWVVAESRDYTGDMLPVTDRTELTKDLSICPLVNGMWQVSGGHGQIDADAAVQCMLVYHDSGFTTWDLADHYGPAEDFVGEFRRRLADSRGEAELATSRHSRSGCPHLAR